MAARWSVRNQAAMRGDHDAEQGGQRGEAEDGGEQQPGRAGDGADRPRQAPHDAERGRHALAALEAQPHREHVPEHGTRGGADGGELADLVGDQHGDHALQRIEQQGRGGELLAAGAQHVGGADVARSDRCGCRRALRRASAAGRTGSSPAGSPSGTAPAAGPGSRSSPRLRGARPCSWSNRCRTWSAGRSARW